MKTDILKRILIFFVFVFFASFLIREVSALTQDLGRHLKFGEIILQEKIVPNINLFSYTEANHSFINTHWFSEVVFYVVFRFLSFPGLIIFAAIIMVASFIIFFLYLYKKDFFWLSFFTSLLAIGILLERTDIRPEIFSFLFFSAYLLILSQNLKEEKTSISLWFLPLIQIFWINMHIYFFLGPVFYSFFFLEKIIKRKISFKDREFKKILIIAFLIILSLFLNPNGINGAMYPAKVMGAYGYSIIENQTPFFLSTLNYHKTILFFFFSALIVLVLGSLLNIVEIFRRRRIFHFCGIIFSSFFGLYAVRNFPIFVFVAMPIIIENIIDIYSGIKNEIKKDFPENYLRENRNYKIIESFFLVIAIFFLVWGIFNNSKKMSLGAPLGAKKAVDFVLENKIPGRMFNNYDIGSYLIWRFYPEKKVFVDNRPEAYSVEFLQSVYIPMQEDREKWEEYSKKYDFNFIIFEITDITPWARKFLLQIRNNPNWPLIYIDNRVAVFVKNSPTNQLLIEKYAIK